MPNQTQPWSKLTSGAIPLLLGDNGDTSYSLGTSATGAGTGSVIISWAELVSGKYPLKFVDNGAGLSYSIGCNNG